MSEIKHIDYVGFTFNGIHSSSLGIVRTSEGSRFNENLLPTIQEKTVQVPGGDGMYHFGSYYTQRQFNISYAFDKLTEEQLAKIKQVFGDKKIHELIFDETPYKKYYAKVTGSASIKHIPFEEGATNRVYKGEGSFQLTAYDPYAYSVNKYLNEYSQDNIEEWKDAANLLEVQGDYDKLIGTEIQLYNPGVKESDFIITFNFIQDSIPAGGINIGPDYQLNFNRISKQGEDTSIKINSKLKLIEGYKANKKSGNIYNKYIKSGQFFKIPNSTDIKMTINSDNESEMLHAYIDTSEPVKYDYIYF